jgi:hypothetical protein
LNLENLSIEKEALSGKDVVKEFKKSDIVTPAFKFTHGLYEGEHVLEKECGDFEMVVHGISKYI